MKGRRLLGLVCLAVLSSSCSKRQPTLNLLVWEGYADPSFVHPFEEANHCKVSASYMGSSDELVAKLRGGSSGNYDVISPSSDVATSIASGGLAAPLDLSKIPSYGRTRRWTVWQVLEFWSTAMASDSLTKDLGA